MRTKSTNNTLLILVILLCILVAGLGLYTFDFHNEVRDREAQLVSEKAQVSEQLNAEITKYSTLLKEKEVLEGGLKRSQERLLELRETLQDSEVTRSKMRQFQSEIRRLRIEREFFVIQNDSLQLETVRLAALQEQTQKALDKVTRSQDSIQQSNRELSDRLSQGARLSVSNLAVRGVIQGNSGKFRITSRAKRAEMIQVCYKVDDNQLANVSNQTFYVQVLNENGKMIGVERSEKWSNGEEILYNSKTTIPYQKTDYTICELVLPVQQLASGDYTVRIFHDEAMLLSTELSLK